MLFVYFCFVLNFRFVGQPLESSGFWFQGKWAEDKGEPLGERAGRRGEFGFETYLGVDGGFNGDIGRSERGSRTFFFFSIYC